MTLGGTASPPCRRCSVPRIVHHCARAAARRMRSRSSYLAREPGGAVCVVDERSSTSWSCRSSTSAARRATAWQDGRVRYACDAGRVHGRSRRRTRVDLSSCVFSVCRVPCAACHSGLVCATELASAAELWTCRALLLDTHTMPCSASCSVRVGAVTDALSMRSRAGRRRSASAHEAHGEAQHAGLFDPRALKIGLSVPSDTRKGLEHWYRRFKVPVSNAAFVPFVRFWQNSPMCEG